MTGNDQRVAIITGGSQGIGAGLVAAYRREGWAVVANSRTIKPSADRAVLTVEGDIGEPATTDRIIGDALGRFGRIDTLINDAGLYISKPFTDYTADDYAAIVGVNLTGFFLLTQRAIAEMLKRRGGHVVNITTTLADYANSGIPSVLTALTKGSLASAASVAAEAQAVSEATGTRIAPYGALLFCVSARQGSRSRPAELAEVGVWQPAGDVSARHGAPMSVCVDWRSWANRLARLVRRSSRLGLFRQP
jgi:NAD(P)-dependent dehydrogenase (short-subunit alcohol dehydrogenase family)